MWTIVVRPQFELCIAGILLAVFASQANGGGPAAPEPQSDLTAMSLEALLDVEVVSASRREQKLSDTASAVYVITHEDIRRSGAATLPDALRLAPGVFVAQIDSSRWMISIRGFSARFSDKLLVMIDGRSVYQPVFSGVYWDLQDVFLEDVERIEVVRGPGGSLWGSNAVNGVIHVITRHSRETQGGVVDLRTGTQDGVIGGVRQGGSIGDKATYRVFGKAFAKPGQPLPDGIREGDDWDMVRGGMRVDWQAGDSDELMVSAGISGGSSDVEQPVSTASGGSVLVRDRSHMRGGHMQADWRHRHSPRLESRLQTFYDRTLRDDLTLDRMRVDVTDIDYQSAFDVSPSNRLMWGGGVRFISDRLNTGLGASFVPPARRTGLQSVFARNEQWLLPNKVSLTLGAKLEHNSFTGWQLQPDVSLLLKPSNDQAVWLSLSRAARLPNRLTSDVRFDVPSVGFVTRGMGNPELKAESLAAYEAGYRVHFRSTWSLDVSGFYQDYSDLATFTVGEPIFEGQLPILPSTFTNNAAGAAYGAETVVGWRLRRRLRLLGSYSFLRVDLRPSGERLLPTALWAEESTPAHIAWAQARTDLTTTLHLDLTYRYNCSFLQGNQPSIHQADVRLAWRLLEHVEFEAGGRDLLDSQYRQSISSEGDLVREIGRNLYVGLRWSL